MTTTRRIFSSFRSKLLLLVLFSLIPAVLLAALSNMEQRKIEGERIVAEITAAAKLIAAHESGYIKNARQLFATLDGFSALVRGSDTNFTRIHFQNLVILSPDYLVFGLIESNGYVFASSVLLTNAPTYLGDRTYFTKAMNTRKFAVGEFQIGRISGENSLNFGYPIFDEQGNVIRVLFGALKLQRLTEAIHEVRLPEGATATVLDRSGNILARFPEGENLLGKPFPNAELKKRIISTQDGVIKGERMDKLPGIHAVQALTDGVSPALFVSIGIPESTLFAQANTQLLYGFILLGVVCVLALLISYLLAERGLLRPTRSLVESAHELASGNLSARAPEKFLTLELANLAEAFNVMAASLQKREAELKGANDQITAMNLELERKVEDRTKALTLANRELEAFSYSVSHDLRAPLRHVVGFLGLLEKRLQSSVDEKSLGYIKTAADSARQMGALIDDLLSFSRLGRSALSQTEINLNQLIAQVIESLASQTEGRQIKWSIAELPSIKGDPPLLRQAFVNLLSNAIKYTRHKETAEIEIRAEVKPAEVVISIRDNGAGFDMEYASKLFGVFQRLHRADEFEGTGIGLANVKRIIERHSGRVWAEGAVDKGATFFVSLPIAS